MAGLASRRKGAAGEREVAEILQSHGFTARRDGRLSFDLDHDVHGIHFEVKRAEALRLPTWHRQAALEAPAGTVPAVVYRRSREEWRVSVSLDYFAALLAVVRDAG